MRFLGGQPAAKAALDTGYDGDDSLSNYYGSLTLGFGWTSYFDATNNNSFTDWCYLYNPDGGADISISWKSQTGHQLTLAGVGGSSYYYFSGYDASIEHFAIELSGSFCAYEVGIDIAGNAIPSDEVETFVGEMYDAYMQGAQCSLSVEGESMPPALTNTSYSILAEIMLMGGGYATANYPETLYISDGGSMDPTDAVGTYNRIGDDGYGYPVYKHETLDWWLEWDGSSYWQLWDRIGEGWLGYDPGAPFDFQGTLGQNAGGNLGEALGDAYSSTGL